MTATITHPAVQLLRLLYGDHPPGYRSLWAAQTKAADWIPAGDYGRVAEYADRLPDGRDAYFVIGLHPEPRGLYERGKSAGVIAIPGLWADVDIYGPAHSAQNLPASIDEAEDLLREFPLPPTAIIDSGHGLHVWWLFEELWTWDPEDQDTRKKAQQLVRRFQDTLGAMAERHGWKVDTTSDLARVLRLPGTTNWKLPDEPAPVRILDIQECCRYRREDFEVYLTKPPQAENDSNVIRPLPKGKGDYTTLDVVSWIKSHGLYGRDLGDGKHAVMCPWADEHTEERAAADSDTVVWEATGDRLWPQFNCLHGHCYRIRGIADVIERLGRGRFLRPRL